jgi:acetyl-CoA synthetase (ADP-forming)
VNVRVSNIIERAFNEGRKNLLEPEAKTVCLEYGIPTPEFLVAATADEAIDCSEKIGYPVVLKIVSPDISHKTEVGGVQVNIHDFREVRDAFDKITDNARRYKSGAKILGVLVQKMAPAGTEVIVGAVKDLQFGQMLMFGLGGIFVEIYKDVTFRLAPITEADAAEMLKEIRAYVLLRGYRGQPPADETALTKILIRVSKLVTDYPQIDELDLNPIMVYSTGASVVDARIVLANERLSAD